MKLEITVQTFEEEENDNKKQTCICTGCGHIEDESILKHGGCCPDNNYIPWREWSKRIFAELIEAKQKQFKKEVSFIDLFNALNNIKNPTAIFTMDASGKMEILNQGGFANYKCTDLEELRETIKYINQHK